MDKRSPDALARAVEYLTQATTLDPKFADAYGWLAYGEFLRTVYSHAGEAGYDAAEQAARKALALDSTIATAHMAIGMIDLIYRDDLPAAERALGRALALNPNLAQAHEDYSHYLTIAGDDVRALQEMQAAVALDPLSTVMNRQLALAYSFAGHHDLAIQQMRKTVEMDPASGVLHAQLANVLLAAGNVKEAVAEAQSARELDPQNTAVLDAYAIAQAVGGDTAPADSMLKTVFAAPYAAPGYFRKATLLMLLGRKTELAAVKEQALKKYPATKMFARPDWRIRWLHFSTN
jgi:tetratricopeptide (TPR) repeat protein